MEKNPANNARKQDGSRKKEIEKKISESDFPKASSQNTKQQKQQQLKEKKPANDFPQIGQQKQQQLKGLKPTKVSEKQLKDEQTASSKSNVPEKIQIQSTGNQQIDQQIEILKNKLVIPKRKNPKAAGKLGRQTELHVNHVPLDLDKLFKKTVYHINCQFNPELPKRLLRTALEQFVEKHYRGIHFAFDGKNNMYVTTELRGKSDLVTVLNEENGKSIDFTIVTSVVNQINMGKIKEYLINGSSNCPPGEAFQALDIVLKNRPFALRFVNVGRSFFPVPDSQPDDLGEGMELWKGFFQSHVIGWKPYLNIDVAHKDFPKYQLLTSYIQNDLNCSLDTELDFISQNTLANYVKGLKVRFMIPNKPNTQRAYKVNGLFESASKFIFKIDDDDKDETKIKTKKMITVLQYFKITKNYTIKYPNLPCLHVGNVNKKIAVPIELCTVQRGQLRMNKLTENQTAQMVKKTAQSSIEQKQTIENCIKGIKYNQDPVLKEFGINVEEQFATISGRVLDQPSLAYYQNKETRPKAGVWKADKFSKAVKLSRWIVLNFDKQTNHISIKNFERMLIQSGKELNVMINPMDPEFNVIFNKNESIKAIEKYVQKCLIKVKNCVPPMELVMVVIPDYPQGIYATIKQASELQVGVLTQCIKSKTMSKMNHVTVGNILLKINLKLNGINHTLSASSCPSSMKGAIIFGADVTHPSPNQTTIPSVAAVAASHDLSGSQYNMEWRLQSPKVEIIQDLEDIVHKQLIKYKDKTKTVPTKIFYFRDGVSDGQFLHLLKYEFIAIRRACLRLNMKYQPPITFLVVHKRHHTRIFPKYPKDMDGKFDFYLCSHTSIQGTTKPTKYHLIWDDNNLTEDELEQLTFYLCFMYVRCTRSVAYPAPTYYARLAAFRARTYIENKTINLNRLDEEQVKNQLNALFTIGNPMFFI
ncbi:Argonaute linker 2 domain,Ribonuclease H-like domain,PAZ domain,Piwi domain,Argonaute, linker 1 [Cinara cedri]|uniref:Argonaute linker 2 domain,Ribonuclease H-like domain,PAZ domain,Piwi domain,Argonaute, linker 1 n=1 Tax=Cinara cedri TaxID=506608 RepID=A0A5E4NB18_9HEMI|nr:Argonaute linker 2 domain,Ribonuclease H-like domain,PAZ domain,Piwi domain,Argonaute, linker 1 [Cinara cedri]